MRFLVFAQKLAVAVMASAMILFLLLLEATGKVMLLLHFIALGSLSTIVLLQFISIFLPIQKSNHFYSGRKGFTLIMLCIFCFGWEISFVSSHMPTIVRLDHSSTWDVFSLEGSSSRVEINEFEAQIGHIRQIPVTSSDKRAYTLVIDKDGSASMYLPLPLPPPAFRKLPPGNIQQVFNIPKPSRIRVLGFRPSFHFYTAK